MKKIFYFIASAIVALGAMACQNEVDENITPENTNDVVSFTVAFDEATRIAMSIEDKTAKFEFEAGDKLYVQPCAVLENDEEFRGQWYTFTTEDGKTFSCQSADLVSELAKSGNYANVESTADGSIRSNEGVDGFNFATYADLTAETVTLPMHNAVFHFTVPKGTTATLTLTKDRFVTKDGEWVTEMAFTEGEHWVAVWGFEGTLSYSIDDVVVKSITKNFEPGTIYNLGTLAPAVAMVNGVNYTDFAKAVAAASTKNVPVTLVSDVAIEKLVEVSGKVTIEGNGYTVSNTGDVFKVLNGGSLTIGEGVTIESATDCGIFTSAGANNVTVVINGTVRTESSDYAAVQFNGYTTGVNLTVNGTIENPNDIALMLPAGGTYTIADGATISGETAIYQKGGNLTIAEGATISANGAVKTYEHMGSGAVSTGDALVVESSDYPAAPATATINGGTFTSTNGKAVAHYVQNEEVAKATISIVGGTFSSNPSEFVAEGYAAGYNNNYIVLPVTGTTYLVPNENWKSNNAWFAAWQWGKTEIMVKATDTNKDGIYEVPVLNGNTSINFDRMDPAKTIADMWDGKWSEAAGATIQADKYYYVTSWNGGIWESATWERPTNVIYFVPGPWTTSNAKISAWTWGGTGADAWATKKFVDSAGVIAFDRSTNWTNVIFLRTSSKENTWDGEWNRSQTTVPTNGNNQYTVNDWNNYKWELNK